MFWPVAVNATAMTLGLTLSLGAGGLAYLSRALAAENEPVVAPSEQFQPRIIEGLPDWYIERLAARQQKILDDLGARHSDLAVHRGLILLNSDEWNPGTTITVAFNGGTPRLHALIERIASVWSQYGNVKFDFGRDASGNYRTWNPTDLDYKADVRVGFLPGGFWSAVGRDGTNPDINQPGNETLNLEGFDRSLPFEFAGIIRHEFGHALGLEHEHQSPVTACDFRWDDDPGYVRTTDKYGQFIVDSQGHRPGIYTVFGGPPNSWSKARIDFNLRQLTTINPDVPVSAYSMGQFDDSSIMKYYYDDWMFVSGNKSPCYSPGVNYELSDEDKKRIAAYYPSGGGAVTATRLQQKREAIDSVLSQVPQSSLLASQLRARQRRLQ
jgi:hypothetical protein